MGHTPETDFAKNFGILDSTGYVLLQHRTETAVLGIYAVGDWTFNFGLDLWE